MRYSVVVAVIDGRPESHRAVEDLKAECIDATGRDFGQINYILSSLHSLTKRLTRRARKALV